MSFWEIFSKDAKELFFEFDPQGSSWRVVTWNFDTDLASGRQWTVEIQSEKSMLIQWKLDTYPVISFFKNQKLIKRQKIKKDLKDLKDLMNL